MSGDAVRAVREDW